MPAPTTSDLLNYVAYCARCGRMVEFRPVAGFDSGLEFKAVCPSGHRWLFLFDVDADGAFGVISFQCDNEDRK